MKQLIFEDPSFEELLSEGVVVDNYLENAEAEALASAEAAGCEVVNCPDERLQIDIDAKEIPQEFWDRLDTLQQLDLLHYDGEVKETRSKSGNWHVAVECRKGLSVETKILLQLFLGSDPMREILSYRRHLNGHAHPIRLFMPKGAV